MPRPHFVFSSHAMNCLATAANATGANCFIRSVMRRDALAANSSSVAIWLAHDNTRSLLNAMPVL